MTSLNEISYRVHTYILFEVEIEEIDGICIGSVRKGPRVGVGEKWVGVEEDMNMGVSDRNGVEGREIRRGGWRVGKGIKGKEDDR